MAHRTVRLLILIGWLVLVLLMVGPVFAQGGDQPTTPENGLQTTAPQNLDDIAVKLTPLLVGAALIERTIEFLFNWAERAVLDTSHYLHSLAVRATGLVQVDLREAWENLNKLKTAVLTRQMQADSLQPGDPESPKMEEWPLEVLEAKLVEAQALFAKGQDAIRNAMDSKVYVLRKKMAASWISIGLGIFLALTANLRLFEPIGIQAAGWFEGVFDKFDLVLAGVLMGLGTEWVHQAIGVLIQGKGLLGRAAGGKEPLDTEQVKIMAQLAVENALREQAEKLKQEIVEDIPRPSSPPL